MSNQDHSKIGPTAKLVAYFRQFSDIPFAAEVAELIHAEEVFDDLLRETGLTPESLKWLAPVAEARYKSVISAIKREGMTQVLEFASGLSLRGLAMTEDPEYTYIETDLPDITEEKRQILSIIKSKYALSERQNLFSYAVNVLSFPQIESAICHFDPSHPVAIIHEGLFHYLSMEEKETAARNIYSVLSRFSGVWITPDFETKAGLEGRLHANEQMQKLTQAITGTTQRDIYNAAFDNQEHIADFFSRLGFNLRISPQVDGSYQLTAMRKLGISEADIENYKSNLNIWTLSIANG